MNPSSLARSFHLSIYLEWNFGCYVGNLLPQFLQKNILLQYDAIYKKLWPIIFTTPNNTSTSETYCLHIWFLSCSIENVILCTKTWWLVLHSAARGFLYLTIGVNILQLTYKNTLSSGTHPSNNILCKQNSLRTLTQCL